MSFQLNIYKKKVSFKLIESSLLNQKLFEVLRIKIQNRIAEYQLSYAFKIK